MEKKAPAVNERLRLAVQTAVGQKWSIVLSLQSKYDYFRASAPAEKWYGNELSKRMKY